MTPVKVCCASSAWMDCSTRQRSTIAFRKLLWASLLSTDSSIEIDEFWVIVLIFVGVMSCAGNDVMSILQAYIVLN